MNFRHRHPAAGRPDLAAIRPELIELGKQITADARAHRRRRRDMGLTLLEHHRCRGTV
ncbi:MAG: hypothetical protein U5O39_14990 [Gammaproteobacteria bacterium]|nr:hypothetical protein [Gammaproteobacteria bacterium]